MNLRLEQGRKGAYWEDVPSKGLSLIRMSDKITISIAVLSLICSLALISYLFLNGGSLYNLIPLITAPFFVCGAIYMVRNKIWLFISVLAVMFVIWYLDLPDMLLYLVMFITLGASGCVSIVSAIQRWMFYRVMRVAEYVNIKRKLSSFDKAIAFAFNIPEDLDTRNVILDHSVCRSHLPWKEMGGTISLGLMVGMLLWIYISMNPAFMGNTSEYNVPMYVFSLVLLIPLIVLPWSIFKSLNVRIETNYRDYKFYNGIRATLTRMALPVFAALVFVIMAINKTSILTVMAYILTSAFTIALVIVFTSAIYYVMFEPDVVRDIIGKWHIFRPVPLFVGLEKSDGSSFDDLPGTPVRDKKDYGSLTLNRR